MRLFALVSLLLCAALTAQERKLDIEGYVTGKPYLVVEKATAIKATSGTMTALEVTYRPGSNVEETETVAVTSGAASWAPKSAGLARLTATITPAGGGDPTKVNETVSVQFDSAVGSGLIVMLLAGIILFGGAFISIRALLRSEA